MMSGGAGNMRMGDEVKPSEIVDVMLELLELDDVKKLEKVPYSVLTKAYNRACRKTGKQLGWRPKANGWICPYHNSRMSLEIIERCRRHQAKA